MKTCSGRTKSNRWFAKVLLEASLSLCVSFSAFADTPSFNAAISYQVGIGSNSLAAFDFNGDGIPDLVTTNSTTDSISVLLGNGDGSFKASVSYAVGSAPVAVAAGDFNHDGRIDLAVVNSGSYNVSILLGSGDGTFKDAVNASVAPHPPVDLAIGDLSGRGILDIAVVSSNHTVSILRGLGDGTFAAATDLVVNNAVALGITQVATAYINADSMLDLVTLNRTDNSVSILLGNGDGSFQVVATYFVFGSLPSALATADFNHDGRIDLAVGSIAGGISVLLGNGDGTFNNAASYSIVGSMAALAVADLDGDGQLDLVAANSDHTSNLGYVTVFLGAGDGGFGPPNIYPVTFSPAGVAVADFNRNGHPDLAVAIPNSTSVAVFLSNAVTPQTGVWWNPAESGRGYTIEKRGDNLFMAAYMYDISGRSTWYGAGPAKMIGPTFTAQLTAYANGQTLTGAWKAPDQIASPGNLTIAFSDATHGTLTWPGGTIPIQKYEFVPNGLNLPHGALEPQTGWWWNKAEGGRGYSVEVQGGNAYIATYMYDASGNPVWYLSGPATLVANIYSGSWSTYSGGQTLTGSYKAPTGSSGAGNLTVQFTSRTTGLLTLPDGRQIPIQRFSF